MAAAGIGDTRRIRYAALCRQGPHVRIEHLPQAGPCECPCHGGEAPWHADASSRYGGPIFRHNAEVPFDAATFAGMKATDATTGDVETVQIGPISGRYVTVSAPDLVAALIQLKRLADEAQMAVMDARQEALEAERQTCHYCGTPFAVEPGMETCGRAECERRYGAEVYADTHLGGI